MFSRIFRKKRPESEVIIDLGKLNALKEKRETIEAASTASSDSTSTDFLGTLAGAGAASTSESISTRTINNSDTERLEHISRRLERALERIDLLEHKITRIEHRTDLKY